MFGFSRRFVSCDNVHQIRCMESHTDTDTNTYPLNVCVYCVIGPDNKKICRLSFNMGLYTNQSDSLDEHNFMRSTLRKIIIVIIITFQRKCIVVWCTCTIRRNNIHRSNENTIYHHGLRIKNDNSTGAFFASTSVEVKKNVNRWERRVHTKVKQKLQLTNTQHRKHMESLWLREFWA